MRADVVEMLQTLRRGGIRDERVLTAMASVPRELFVPPGHDREAYADASSRIACTYRYGSDWPTIRRGFGRGQAFRAREQLDGE